jgi:hypothetical protein
VAATVVYHFSEDPTITRFAPHVPRTNPSHPAAVWAIDAQHAPLYWFPRDCPRVTVWPHRQSDAAGFRQAFATEAHRVHAIELDWLDRMRTAELHRYEFDATDFVRWPPASGQWIAEHDVEPLSITPVGDLMQAHVTAGIELRMVPSLWPLHDLAVGDLAVDGPVLRNRAKDDVAVADAAAGARWDFSVVRMANAQPRNQAAAGAPDDTRQARTVRKQSRISVT